MIRLAMLAATLLAATFAQAEGDGIHPVLRPQPLPSNVTPKVAMSQCGEWIKHYGPFDYRTASPDLRARVEFHHFDKYMNDYLSWVPGKPFDKYIAANLSYTLRAFPNHPTTMMTFEQIGRRLKTDDIPGSYFPLECWFVRGIQAVPDDPMVRAQYGIYLAFRGRKEEARINLDIGDKGLCTSRTMQYQIGLANVKVGAFEAAQKNALRAERMGFEFPQLKKQIVDAGKWRADVTLPEGPGMDCPVPEAETAENKTADPAK